MGRGATSIPSPRTLTKMALVPKGTRAIHLSYGAGDGKSKGLLRKPLFRCGPLALACCAGKCSRIFSASHPAGFDSRRPLQESHACLYRQAFRFNAAKKTVILSRFSFPSITYRSTLLRNLNLSKAPVFFSLLYRTCVVNVIELAELFYFKVL